MMYHNRYKISFFHPFFYILELNCIWSTWNEGPCTETCGKGMKMSTRVKIQEEAFGGTCEGEESKIEECKMRDCPPPRMFYHLFE